jgi:hypothetical protein
MYVLAIYTHACAIYTCTRTSGGQSGLTILVKVREPLTDPVSCEAGAALSVYPVLRIILQSQHITDPALNRKINCFQKLCDVLDLLQLASVPGRLCPVKLQTAILEHSRALLSEYGAAAWTVKNHMALHLPRMAHHLISCFVHERKHKEVKRFANLSRSVTFKNTNWDHGVLQNVLRVHLHDLNSSDNKLMASNVRLINPKENSTSKALCQLLGVDDNVCVSSLHAVVGGVHIIAGDIVMVSHEGGTCVAEVWNHFCVDGQFFSVVSVWDHTQHANLFKVNEQPCLVSSENISQTLYYRHIDPAHVLVAPRHI